LILSYDIFASVHTHTCHTNIRVPSPPGKSWIVLDFFCVKIPGPGKALKMNLVVESHGNLGAMKYSCKVLEIPGIC